MKAPSFRDNTNNYEPTKFSCSEDLSQKDTICILNPIIWIILEFQILKRFLEFYSFSCPGPSYLKEGAIKAPKPYVQKKQRKDDDQSELT